MRSPAFDRSIINNMKIKYKFILFFCVTLLFFIGITNFIMFRNSSSYINKKIAETSLLQNSQQSENISFILKSYERVVNYFYLSDDFKSTLAKQYLKMSEKIEVKAKVLNYISSVTLAYELLPKIKIYTYNDSLIVDNDLFFNIDDFQKTAWKDEIVETTDKVKIYKWLKTYKVSENSQDKYYIGEAALLTDDLSQQKIALVSLELDAVKLFDFLNTGSDPEKGKNELLVADDAGQVIYSTEPGKITSSIHDQDFFQKAVSKDGSGYFSDEIDGVKKIIVYNPVRESDWLLFHIIDDVPSDEIRNILNFTVILTLSVILFGVIVTYIYVSLIVKRILELTNAMTLVGDGNFEVTTSIVGTDEIGKMNHVFLNMVREIKRLFQQVRDTEKSKHRLELMSLEEQIKPHFLYNTFSAIGKMALNVEAEDIYAAILSLTQYYKISLSHGQDVILISDELKHAKAYVSLINLRFNNKANVAYDIDESILKLYTPKLILQPLLENAFFHGFNKKMESPGMMRMKIMRSEAKVIFEISDNGVGISKERINEILESKTEGFALKNIDTRIKLICGNEFGLQLKSEPGEGTTATIIIPVISELGQLGTADQTEAK
jgi:two-component system, sensor histidine kinase YesM